MQFVCCCIREKMKLYIFNPENDLALADGNSNYCPPPMARTIAYDLATLPLWYAVSGDYVLLPSDVHAEYAVAMSRMFNMASACVDMPLQQPVTIVPWGWSAQMKRRMQAMGIAESRLPSQYCLEQLRVLSNRRVTIDILQALHSAGVETPEYPMYTSSPADVAAFINSMPRSVIKAPWSGSGKGIAWGIGRVEVPVEHFYMGVIKRQGGVVCERYLDKVVDFAMEFSLTRGVVSFAGYSLFTCDGGSYSGNILASDAAIEDFLQGYVSHEELVNVRETLLCILTRLLAPIEYDGFLGVDMLIYRGGGCYRLNPCIELNLRMNMGAVSRIFFDRFVATGSQGRFSVSFYKAAGDALAAHRAMSALHPLCVKDGKVVSGYLSLSPVVADSRYLAFAIVTEESKPLNELYFAK